ncbi:hypothetical protein [Aquimarina agarivorans]|uniref:hypothetical protein n=1 Tax=Aquimarina agarivorans TaxID=980584 RepID=UPI000248FD27|nr:hypothetical protein [Aquimarina agarivorans]
MKEPYYMVNFSASACLFEIRINDQPVLTMNVEGQVSTSIPVNYTISSSGKQEVTIKILPLSGTSELSKKASLNYSIKYYDTTVGFNLIDTFDGFESAPVNDEKLPLIVGGSFFEAEIPYSLRDYWKNGKDIVDVKNYILEIRKAYKEIANLIVTSRYDILKQKMENREYNMATSMYLSAKDSQNRINRMINDFKNGYNQLIFDEKSLPVISAYGKKISLKRLNGDPVLSFGSIEEQEQIMLDIEFYWSKETKQFEII